MWKDQYDRMYRSAGRVRDCYSRRGIDEGYDGTTEFPAFRDAVIHTFQDIFHLRDWLCNDSSVQIPDADIKDLFVNNPQTWPALHIARDIANGSKHLENKRPSHSGEARVSQTGHVSVEYGTEPGGAIRQSISVHTDASALEDALVLVERCLNEWDAFLTEHGLV